MADFDLAGALNSILSDPETGEKIQSLIASLSAPEKSAESKEEGSKNQPFPDIGQLLQMKELYESAMNESDTHIALLSSLRPYLSESRSKNLDSVMKMLRVYKIINKVKDTPLLKELF